MTMSKEDCRYFLKDSIRLEIDFGQTDQNRGIAPPPIEKPFAEDSTRIDLVPPENWQTISGISLTDAIKSRVSRRSYTKSPLSLEELSFLLWATQGIRMVLGPGAAYRTVPSAGCRHAFETYLCIQNVSGLAPGVYRYLPLEHQLLLEFEAEQSRQKLVRATLGQTFVGAAPVTFVWTVIPYRMEWRYGLAAAKTTAIDIGHVCQNLYLAVSAINCGTCAVAAYHQELMDQLLNVDGEEKFVIYLAPVGKVG